MAEQLSADGKLQIIIEFQPSSKEVGFGVIFDGKPQENPDWLFVNQLLNTVQGQVIDTMGVQRAAAMQRAMEQLQEAAAASGAMQEGEGGIAAPVPPPSGIVVASAGTAIPNIRSDRR